MRWYNITLKEKGFHHINDIYKPYIKRYALGTYNINSILILNTLL